MQRSNAKCAIDILLPVMNDTENLYRSPFYINLTNVNSLMKKNTIAALIAIATFGITSCRKFETCTCKGSDTPNGEIRTVYVQEYRKSIASWDDINFQTCQQVEYEIEEYYKNVDCSLE